MSYDLDPIDSKVLRYVADHPSASMIQMEEGIPLARKTVLAHVNYLVTKGYLSEERKVYPRSRLLTLTDKGRLVVRDLELLEVATRIARTDIDQVVSKAVREFEEETFLFRPLRIASRWSNTIDWMGFLSGKGVGPALTATMKIEAMLDGLDEAWPRIFNKLQGFSSVFTSLDHRPSERLRSIDAMDQRPHTLESDVGLLEAELKDFERTIELAPLVYKEALREFVTTVSSLLT